MNGPTKRPAAPFVRSKTIGPTHAGAVSYGAYGASGNGTDHDQETGPSIHELELSRMKPVMNGPTKRPAATARRLQS